MPLVCISKNLEYAVLDEWLLRTVFDGWLLREKFVGLIIDWWLRGAFVVILGLTIDSNGRVLRALMIVVVEIVVEPFAWLVREPFVISPELSNY